MNEKQIYEFSRENFEVYFHTRPDGSAMTTKAGRIPFMFWPDGHWCTEINLFLMSLYDMGVSHKGDKGGTLGTYAAYLSHLVRRSYLAGITDFSKITNSHFRNFVLGLNAEKILKNERLVSKRNITTQDKIVCVWLDFLQFVGSYAGIENFLGKTGSIQAYKKFYKKKVGANRYVTGEKWCWPRRMRRKLPVHRRLPINDAQFNTLKTTADLLTDNPFIRRRRLAMFVVYDSLGLRRAEMAKLTVQSVRNALRELDRADKAGDLEFIPSLRFATVKGRISERECPISRVNLRYIETYIEKFRLPLVKTKNPNALLNGPLFVSAKTGAELKANTFTQEFFVIRKLCGMTESASPHLMRHRFITKLFVRLILAHALNTTDELKRLLLSTEAIKEHVRQITGHATIDSLDVYIHLAIDEVTEFRKTIKRVTEMNGMDTLSDIRERYKIAMATNTEVSAVTAEFASAVDAVLSSYRPGADYMNAEEWTSFLAKCGPFALGHA